MKQIITHKTKYLIALSLSLLLIFAFAACSNPAPASAEEITVDQAKEIAITHAGIAAADANFLKTEKDTDDGVTQYEIEFIVGDMEYEYKIDAVSGEILEESQETTRLRAN